MSDSVSGCTEPHTALSAPDVEALVRGICFKTGPPRRLGVEVEWLVHELREPQLPVTPERLEAAYAALRNLPLRSALTVEPGGQLELSSLPAATLTECIETVSADLDAVRTVLREDGLTLVGLGQDPWHEPRRFLREPRYDAMEALPGPHRPRRPRHDVHLRLRAGVPGRRPRGARARSAWCDAGGWPTDLGPVLVAAFANSPLAGHRPTGWLSTRQLLWTRIGAGRAGGPPLDADPRGAWARHVLDSPVMCVRRDGGPWDVPEGLTFREWIRTGAPRPPTREDLDYHVTTLFPPVRPRGHLELRMIDAQPGDDGWIVPLAVTAALFDDPEAAETAYRAVKPLAERDDWGCPRRTTRCGSTRPAAGLADAELREVAVTCFTAALDALPRLGAAPEVTDAVAAYLDRYVVRGRCPADDLLDRQRGTDGRAHGKDIRT